MLPTPQDKGLPEKQSFVSSFTIQDKTIRGFKAHERNLSEVKWEWNQSSEVDS